MKIRNVKFKKGLIVATLVALFAVAGCGSSEETGSSEIPSSSEEVITAGVLEKLKEMPFDKKEALALYGDSYEGYEDFFYDGFSSYEDYDNSFVFGKYKLEHEEKEITKIPANLNAKNKVYPGEVVHGDRFLSMGEPVEIASTHLPRNSMFYEVITDDVAFSSFSSNSFSLKYLESSISRAIDDKELVCNVTLDKIMAYSEAQVGVETGIFNSSQSLDIDYFEIENGKQNVMLAIYTGEILRIRTAPINADEIYTKGAKGSELEKEGVDEFNPGMCLITEVVYGFKAIYKFTSYSVLPEAMQILEEGVTEEGFSSDLIYSKYANNQLCSLYFSEASNGITNYGEATVRNIGDWMIQPIDIFNGYYDFSELVPVSFTASFIDDCSPAIVHTETDLSHPYLCKLDATNVSIINGGLHFVTNQQLLGRAIVDMDENNNIILGPWEVIYEGGNTTTSFDVNGKYVEFAYGYKNLLSTDWLFYDTIFTIDDGIVDSIKISTSGILENTLEILVNNYTVYYNSNCQGENVVKILD